MVLNRHRCATPHRPCFNLPSFSPAAFSVSTCFAKWKRMKRCSGSRKKLEPGTPATPISRTNHSAAAKPSEEEGGIDGLNQAHQAWQCCSVGWLARVRRLPDSCNLVVNVPPLKRNGGFRHSPRP